MDEAGSIYPLRRPVVVHVVEAFAAGTGRHVLDLVRHLSEFDHVIAAPSRHRGESTAPAVAAAKAAGASVELIEMGRFRSPRRHASALRALRQTIGRVRPDIVHGHSSIGGAMARLATIRSGIPTVYTPHGLSRSRLALAAERTLADQASLLIAVSEGERDFALAQGVAREERTVVILNGVEPDSPAPLVEPLRASLGLDADVPLVGSIGRLTWQKAPEVFLQACEIAATHDPAAHFVLIGVGARHTELAQLVRQSAVADRFHLVPSLPNAAAALCELDVYASASRFEGAPYTPLEAMRAGTPVVVTDVTGNRDIVRNEQNGLLVPSESPADLAGAIVRLLSDEVLRARVIRNGRRTATRCDVRIMAEATAGVYDELRGGRRRGSRPLEDDPGWRVPAVLS